MRFLFAWRYFRSKKSTNAINVIAWISITAIAVGCAALIVVLSVFNGFEDLVKGLYADFYADMRVVPASGKTMTITEAQLRRIRTVNGISAVSFTAEEKAVLSGASQAIVTVKGVDDQYTDITRINTPQHLLRGSFAIGDLANPGLIVGSGIENAAGVETEKGLYPATLYLPNREAKRLTADDGLNAFSVHPAGTFSVQQDFDNQYVFTNLAFVKYMLGMQPDEYSALEMKVEGDINTIRKSLSAVLGENYRVETRYEQNQGLYRVMQTEKWVIYAILSLILVVAAFNMIGALTMLVLEKQKDIAILQALGAGRSLIQQIFLGEGLLLAAIGGAGGAITAALICWLQAQYHLIKLGGNTFIIDYYPVKLLPGDFLLVVTTIFFIAIAASWLPARKAIQHNISLKS
jgi:lipoprotein-releasing system permease protein